MTNAEKFEEIFGYKISELNPDPPCGAVEEEICMKHSCDKCPMNNFWFKQYQKRRKTING